MRRLGIIHLGLVLLVLMQGVMPVAGMARTAAMAVPEHGMTGQCSHMDSRDMTYPLKDPCGPGADCCLVKAGVQPMATYARTTFPRLVVIGFLMADKDLAALPADKPDLQTESEAPPPLAIPLYKVNSAFLI